MLPCFKVRPDRAGALSVPAAGRQLSTAGIAGARTSGQALITALADATTSADRRLPPTQAPPRQHPVPIAPIRLRLLRPATTPLAPEQRQEITDRSISAA